MTEERRRQVEELYHAACEFGPDQRGAFLAEACHDDEELRKDVELLLVEEAASDQILGCPMWDRADSTKTLGPSTASSTEGWLPAKIGPYRILRLVGKGGMGVVYEAEQEKPRRIVALKVIKPGLTSPGLLRRFEQEAQALGRLQHPGIAQIHEAGTADTGFGPQPYFAMELIRGSSLLTYAEEHHLDTRQRLEIVIKVCDAVHHAHQRGIIHRDLKPGNILVDETGQPKILDFGVARVTDSDAQATRQTDLGQLVGTLAYMSPEQVLGDPLEVDMRSDVYALGVILYELFAGRMPYRIEKRKLHEAVQAIREEDPVPLSSISRRYRGDIETIVAKALEKDKGRRYGSAAALAADMRHHLADEPITARPASTTYQLQKFARRHKALVAGVGAVFVVLMAGIVASTWQAARARRAEQAALIERDRAVNAEKKTATALDRALAAEAQAREERNTAVAEKQRADMEAATAKAVNEFLQGDLLAQASANTQARPDTKPDPDLKVRTALDRAAARIPGKFDKQPRVEASIRQTIASTYNDLGLYGQARQQVERVIELRRRVMGEEHPDTLTSMNDLADVYVGQGNYAQAEPLYSKVLEIRRRVLGEEHRNTLRSMNDLGLLNQHQGKYAEAELLLTKVVEIRRRLLGESHPDTLASLNNLGLLYQYRGKYAQAEPLLTRVLSLHRRVAGEEHPNTLRSMNSLATLYQYEGKYAQAEPLYAKALEIQRRVLGEEHPDTLILISNLGMLYQNQRKYAQAEPLQTKAVEIRRRVLGEEHPNTLVSMNNLGLLYQNQGQYAQAEPLFTRVLEIRRRVQGEEHPNTLRSGNNLAALYLEQGKYAQAEPLFNDVVDIQRRVLGEEHHDTLASISNLAGLHLQQGKYAQAGTLYAKTLEIRRRVLGEGHPDTSSAMASLGEVRLSQQSYTDAESLLRNALKIQENTDAGGWERYYIQSLLGACLTGQKRYEDAEPLLLSGYSGLIQRKATIPAARKSNLARAGEWIVRLYQDWGKPEDAAEWREKVQKTTVRER